ncbi:MAG: GtrA family protein [Rubrivivax sp.]
MNGSQISCLARYALVGLVATGMHWGLLVATVERAHWPAWAGSGLGAVVGAQVAYVGNRCFTFRQRGGWIVSWWRFQWTAAGGALLSMALVALAQDAGLHYLVGQCVATGVAMLATYVVNRRWSFAATRGPG